MNIVTKALVYIVPTVLVIGGLAFAATCPCGPVPGVWMSGETQDAPIDDWSFANQAGLCQLQVQNTLPHVINLNCMSHDDRLFVSCSNCDGKSWSSVALQKPQAEIKVNDSIYPINMQRITESAHLDQIWLARIQKVGGDPARKRPDHWWSFELTSEM